MANLVTRPGTRLTVVTVVAAGLLNLLVKGAVSAYYLRMVEPVGPDGAVKPRTRPLVQDAWTDHR